MPVAPAIIPWLMNEDKEVGSSILVVVISNYVIRLCLFIKVQRIETPLDVFRSLALLHKDLEFGP